MGRPALEGGLEGVHRLLGQEEGCQQQRGRAPEPEGLEEGAYGCSAGPSMILWCI